MSFKSNKEITFDDSTSINEGKYSIFHKAAINVKTR